MSTSLALGVVILQKQSSWRPRRLQEPRLTPLFWHLPAEVSSRAPSLPKHPHSYLQSLSPTMPSAWWPLHHTIKDLQLSGPTMLEQAAQNPKFREKLKNRTSFFHYSLNLTKVKHFLSRPFVFNIIFLTEIFTLYSSLDKATDKWLNVKVMFIIISWATLCICVCILYMFYEKKHVNQILSVFKLQFILWTIKTLPSVAVSTSCLYCNHGNRQQSQNHCCYWKRHLNLMVIKLHTRSLLISKQV